jgi:hypothetical protein
MYFGSMTFRAFTLLGISLSSIAGLFLSMQTLRLGQPAEISSGRQSNSGDSALNVSLLCPCNGGKIVRPELLMFCANPIGISVELFSDKNCYSVWEGRVTAIVRMPDGNGSLVIVRHGNLLSVYLPLDTLCVKKDEVIKAHQKIGRVAENAETDFLKDESGKTLLGKPGSSSGKPGKTGKWIFTFQLWKGQEKLDAAEYIPCLNLNAEQVQKSIRMTNEPENSKCGTSEKKKFGCCIEPSDAAIEKVRRASLKRDSLIKAN